MAQNRLRHFTTTSIMLVLIISLCFSSSSTVKAEPSDGLFAVKVVNKNTVNIGEQINITIKIENLNQPITQSEPYRNDTLYNVTINEYQGLPPELKILNETVYWWNNTDPQKKLLNSTNLTIPAMNTSEWVKLTYQINATAIGDFTLSPSNISYVYFTNTISGANETRYHMANDGQGISIHVTEPSNGEDEKEPWIPSPGTKNLTMILVILMIALPILGVFLSAHWLKQRPRLKQNRSPRR